MNKISISRTQVETFLADSARRQGLRFLGVSPLDVAADAKRYEEWLAEGRQAGMAYLERNVELRKNPKDLMRGAKSAFMFGLPYDAGDRWRRGEGFETPKIAMYARLKDYHHHLKSVLGEIAKDFVLSQEDISYRVTVDSAPVLERALGAGAAQGFIGKNTCYIHPRFGSFLLLGEIITSWVDDSIQPVSSKKIDTTRTPDGGCGTCKRCQVHCPTGALDDDYRIDARKCLSWWTIENRGAIPYSFWPWIGQYLFGCDICQLVCPWNRGKEPDPSTERLTLIKGDIDPFVIATMDQKTYEKIFAATPVTRAKREGLIRNALIALYVRNDPRIEIAMNKNLGVDHPAIAETISMILLKLNKTENP